MEYRGYTARIEFDEDASVLFGQVEGLRDVVTFEATDVKGLEAAFHDSVDDYLEMCALRNEEADKPYSGKFLIRLEPRVHREIAMAAARTGKSLNALANELFRGWLTQEGTGQAIPYGVRPFSEIAPDSSKPFASNSGTKVSEPAAFLAADVTANVDSRRVARIIGEATERMTPGSITPPRDWNAAPRVPNTPPRNSNTPPRSRPSRQAVAPSTAPQELAA